MSVGVTKDYKLKVKNLHASHTLGWYIMVCVRVLSWYTKYVLQITACIQRF